MSCTLWVYVTICDVHIVTCSVCINVILFADKLNSECWRSQHAFSGSLYYYSISQLICSGSVMFEDDATVLQQDLVSRSSCSNVEYLFCMYLVTFWKQLIDSLSMYLCFCLAICLQCFDTVGWVSGRISGPQQPEWWGAIAWLSVWSKVPIFTWPSWWHCHLVSLASIKFRLALPFWY